MLGQRALHVRDRDMSLKRHAVDDRGMAGREVSGQADLTLQHLTAIIVDDLDLAAELLTHLRRPFLATAATRIAVHGDVGRGRCDRWDGH